jgi:hypothetical protein
VPKKKRGRGSNASVNEKESQTVPKKRGRPSTSKAEVAPEKQAEQQPAPKKKRGRPSISRPEDQATAKAPEEAGSSKPRKRGRPSKTQQELEATQQAAVESQSGPEKPGRIPKTAPETGKRRARRSDASDTAGGQGAASSAATSQKVRKSRKDNGNASDEESSQANATTREKSKKKRKEADTSVVEKAVSKDREQGTEQRRSQKSTQGSQETQQTERPLTYQHLAEVTHRVSRQAIETKWESLPPACIERVSSLLEDTQRPVVVRLGDERKRTQASTALQMVSRRLVSKISKGLPFPQSTGARREDDFDFEKILDRCRDLEAQLTLALHANDLLESELGKENAHLEAEEDALSQLLTNAKIEASRRKEAGRKLHVLLQSEDAVKAEDGLQDEAGLGAEVHGAPLSLVSLVSHSYIHYRQG